MQPLQVRLGISTPVDTKLTNSYGVPFNESLCIRLVCHSNVKRQRILILDQEIYIDWYHFGKHMFYFRSDLFLIDI